MLKLTVFYESPYWVGIFEEVDGDCLVSARVVFGPEPKDYEVYDWIMKNYYKLKFTAPLSVMEKVDKRINPKRLQRQISKEQAHRGVSTKAMEAIRLEREKNKLEKKSRNKHRKEAEAKRKFNLKQEKKKEKKKGH